MDPKPKDFSTAILEQKKAPNKLMIEDTTNDDNSTVYLSEAKLADLKIFKGDPVLLKGKKRKGKFNIFKNNFKRNCLHCIN